MIGHPQLDTPAYGWVESLFVQGGILISATLVIAVNLSVDLLYGWANPRIRHGR